MWLLHTIAMSSRWREIYMNSNWQMPPNQLQLDPLVQFVIFKPRLAGCVTLNTETNSTTLITPLSAPTALKIRHAPRIYSIPFFFPTYRTIHPTWLLTWMKHLCHSHQASGMLYERSEIQQLYLQVRLLNMCPHIRKACLWCQTRINLFLILEWLDGSTKNSVTAVGFITLSGKMLPTAIVKHGKTPKCLQSRSTICRDYAFCCVMSCMLCIMHDLCH